MPKKQRRQVPQWASLNQEQKARVGSWLRDQIHEMRHERASILEHSGLDVDWLKALLETLIAKPEGAIRAMFPSLAPPVGELATLKAVDGVPGDLCIRVDIRVADDDSNALALFAEARKFAKKMVKAEQIGTQEEQFEIGAVRVTTSRATDEGAGGR